jgi:hypothetical protein
MPHTPEHIASTASPADLPPPKPLPRPGEPIETTRARLVYQSRKRGTLESDLLLSTFAQERLGAMDAEELTEFDKVRRSRKTNNPSLPPHSPFHLPLPLCVCVDLRSERSYIYIYIDLLRFFSSWTSRIGTFIIGLRESGRRPSDGRARRYSRS